MNHFVLDFSDIKTVLQLHQYLKEIFSLPDYYGNNMDVLWDCLSCCYDESTTIELRYPDCSAFCGYVPNLDFSSVPVVT